MDWSNIIWDRCKWKYILLEVRSSSAEEEGEGSYNECSDKNDNYNDFNKNRHTISSSKCILNSRN